MARCPSCAASLPCVVCLNNLLRSRRDPRAQVFTCRACGKEAALSLGSQCFSIAFVIISGTLLLVFELSRPEIVRQPRFRPPAIIALLFLNYLVICYAWWRFLVKLRVHRAPTQPGRCEAPRPPDSKERGRP